MDDTARRERDQRRLEIAIPGTAVSAVFTTRSAGDLRPLLPGAEARQAEVEKGTWCWTRQVHGRTVVLAEGLGEAADGLVSDRGDLLPAMFAADCALVAMASPSGLRAAVHAGWPGLLAGVVEAAASLMRSEGASDLLAVRGPCIGPECYEFGPADLARLAERYGPGICATTASGRPALDLAAGVRLALERAEVALVAEVSSCTACALTPEGTPRWFSHRARRDEGRHALVVAAR